jgi:1-acyl-sn-glycerol-3-phosphate acyltransferase
MPRAGQMTWRPTGGLIRAAAKVAFGLQITYQAQVPSGPLVIACNHYSHLDPPLLAAAITRPVRCIALEDLMIESRVMRALLTHWGAIPMSRVGSNVPTVRAALGYLRRGGAVGLFPEGRRVAAWGDEPPHRGAAWLAAAAPAPLLPIAVTGTDRVFGLDNRFRRGRIGIVVGRPIPPLTGKDGVAALNQEWEEWERKVLDSSPES